MLVVKVNIIMNVSHQNVNHFIEPRGIFASRPSHRAVLHCFVVRIRVIHKTIGRHVISLSFPLTTCVAVILTSKHIVIIMIDQSLIINRNTQQAILGAAIEALVKAFINVRKLSRDRRNKAQCANPYRKGTIVRDLLRHISSPVAN